MSAVHVPWTAVPQAWTKGRGSRTAVLQARTVGNGSLTRVPQAGSKGHEARSAVLQAWTKGRGSLTRVPQAWTKGNGTRTALLQAWTKGHGALTRVLQAWTVGHGLRTAVPGAWTRVHGTLTADNVSRSADHGLAKSGSRTIRTVGTKRARDRAVERGEKEGACWQHAPETAGYFTASGVGVELEEVCGSGSGFAFRLPLVARPRNGCCPNSVIFSLSLP